MNRMKLLFLSFFVRFPIKDMHICRSALSCCVVTGLPYDVIKKYCVPRDIATSFDEDFRGDESGFSERSDELTSDDEEAALFQVPIPPNGYVVDENEMIAVDE